MRGQAAWWRTLEVRERFLAAGPDWLPPEDCGVPREIEARLLTAAPAAEHELLGEVARMWKQRSQAVVVLSEEVFVANAAALTLLGGGAGHDLLRDWARECARAATADSREHTACLELGPDLAVTARCRTLPAPSRHLAAVVTLTRSAVSSQSLLPTQSPRTRSSSSLTSSPPSSPVTERLQGELARARAAGLPVLLRGGRGTGKTTLARACHDRTAAPGTFTVADCALSEVSPRDWARRLGAALADPAATVVLQHLDALDPAVVMVTAALITSARAWLAATTTATAEEPGVPAALGDRFGVVVDVPPLRDRAGAVDVLRHHRR